jgi:4-hydroxy-4-methyl-2-oxoglutarate aldolase
VVEVTTAEVRQVVRRELFTAVVGDVLDAAGLTQQFLPPQIRPLRPDTVIIGRAATVLEADCADSYVAHETVNRPFGLMMEALDGLRPGDIYICTGASPSYALWGGLMSTRAMRLGAAGAILDGYSRDTREITERLGFPTFSRGPYGQDQGVRGRVIDYGCRLRFGNGVIVRSGDLLFGDIDGVVVVPFEHEDDIIQAALVKVRGESKVRRAIEDGMPAREAYDTYGIM